MTDRIEFTDAEFSFRHDGVTYHVSTEAGNGPARVVVEVTSEQEPIDMEGDAS